jgi:hypothetical protein
MPICKDCSSFVKDDFCSNLSTNYLCKHKTYSTVCSITGVRKLLDLKVNNPNKYFNCPEYKLVDDSTKSLTRTKRSIWRRLLSGFINRY